MACQQVYKYPPAAAGSVTSEREDVPTNLSPVEWVDAAGCAVVHQSCFGSAGEARRTSRYCQ